MEDEVFPCKNPLTNLVQSMYFCHSMNAEQYLRLLKPQQEIERLRQKLVEKEQIIEACHKDHTWLDERLKFERLLADLSATFVALPPEEVEARIQHGLKKVVEFLGVDRSTFFKFSEDGSLLWTIASYARPGFDTFPFIRIQEEFPLAVHLLTRGEIVAWSGLEKLSEKVPIDKDNLLRAGLVANVNIPIQCEGRVKFVLSAGSMSEEREWPEDLFPRLRLMGEIFTNAFVRKQKEEELAALHKQLQEDNVYLQEELSAEHHFRQIVGRSDALRYALHRVEQVAQTDMSVLIQGETGTGKELVAREIHHHSLRKERPLIKVNCAALASHLIESELFGHIKGAFTGAVANRKGRFEVADGATLFLDEIGELPLELQAKLLQVLESGEFERVGSSETIRTDVRIIAATNRHLDREVEAGRFREDLWHRLNVFQITVPPLRERLEDLQLLVSTFMKQLNHRLDKEIDELPRKTLETLQAYSWPGNVRELRHVIERAMLLSPGKCLQLAGPLSSGRHFAGQNDPPISRDIDGLQAVASEGPLHEVEREYILRILEKTYWRVHGPHGAAAILGMNPSTLRARMKKLGIQRPDVKRTD